MKIERLSGEGTNGKRKLEKIMQKRLMGASTVPQIYGRANDFGTIT